MTPALLHVTETNTSRNDRDGTRGIECAGTDNQPGKAGGHDIHEESPVRLRKGRKLVFVDWELVESGYDVRPIGQGGTSQRKDGRNSYIPSTGALSGGAIWFSSRGITSFW